MTAAPNVDKAARAICAEQCAFYGEPPCWQIAPGDWPNPQCNEPGCMALAQAATSAAHRSGYEAARADAAKVGWQPIETAPKDGTLIDLWGRNLLHYAKIGERVVNVKWGRCTDWLGNERDDWLHRPGEDYEPTHWMPLPEPPEATP